jgi:hypothetical protein
MKAEMLSVVALSMDIEVPPRRQQNHVLERLGIPEQL